MFITDGRSQRLGTGDIVPQIPTPTQYSGYRYCASNRDQGRGYAPTITTRPGSFAGACAGADSVQGFRSVCGGIEIESESNWVIRADRVSAQLYCRRYRHTFTRHNILHLQITRAQSKAITIKSRQKLI